MSFSWNNGLREAVVTDTFLFLSTLFIQVHDQIITGQIAYVNNVYG
jgi:hypothetical protein